jgi:uncharacterized protein (TIGR00730 family)
MSMKISVYCSSAPDLDPLLIDFAYELGKGIAEAGHDLVWGGAKVSMMGAVARGARDHGAKTIGVIPRALVDREIQDPLATELHLVDTMRERKALIEELSDGFIAMPGGIGTLEEFFEIWVGRYLAFHAKPIAILDPINAYGPLKSALDHLATHNLMKSGQSELISWTTQVPAALTALSR